MKLKEINGQAATNRAGAAEYLGIPIGTVRVYSSPGQRPHTGWPAPVRSKGDENSDGQDWFALNHLDAYRAASTSAPYLPPPEPTDPGRLLSLTEVGELRGVSHKTMYRYLELSEPHWRQGRDGMLPLPDEPMNAGIAGDYRWRYDRAASWAFPPAPRKSTGRSPGRRPQPQDLASLLAEPGAQSLKNRELAEQLGARLGVDITLQTIHRLKRSLRSGSTKP